MIDHLEYAIEETKKFIQNLIPNYQHTFELFKEGYSIEQIVKFKKIELLHPRFEWNTNHKKIYMSLTIF